MNLRLICIKGPLKGRELVVKENITIGRNKGDLHLKDAKASGLHAKIYSDNKGLIQIEDLGSSNGTYVNDVKIKGPTPLNKGDLIVIGKSTLRVEGPVSKKNETESEKGSWQEKIELALDAAWTRAQKEKNPPPVPRLPVLPFDEPVILDFVQGLQTGRTAVFGFGPREVGLHATDLLLDDEDSASVAFELHPKEGVLCELKAHGENISVNGTPVKTADLKNGDRLSFGHTVILVRAFKTI